MDYQPIKEEKKQEWIKWLESQKRVLDGQPEVKGEGLILKTPEGDVATCKDLVGNLLATLTGNTVTIN